MSHQSNIRRISKAVGAVILVSMAGVQAALAADQDVDPQTRAAYLLQHPQIWTTQVDEVVQASYASKPPLDAHVQAQRVFQPVSEAPVSVTEFSATDQMLASRALDPQVQAARLLSHSHH